MIKINKVDVHNLRLICLGMLVVKWDTSLIKKPDQQKCGLVRRLVLKQK